MLVMVSVNSSKYVLIFLKGHNTMGSSVWLITFYWTTFLFIKTQLYNSSILDEGYEYMHIFELKSVQKSFTHLCDLMWCTLMYV